MYKFPVPNYKENNIVNLMSSISNSFGKQHQYENLKSLAPEELNNFENIALIVVWTIWVDFILKIFIWPEFSIFWNIVRPFIKNKEKFWVWAVQKKFAWIIGFILSTFVIYCLLLLSWIIECSNPQVLAVIQQVELNILNNLFIVLPMNPAILACVLCIIFMFLEAFFGICVWCKIYKTFVSKWVMKEYEWQKCVNWACEMKK